MKRRDFLKNAVTGVVLPSFINGLPLKALAGTPAMHAIGSRMEEGKALVIIQLAGGNDGLNTVIPADQYNTYLAARANIAIPETKLVCLDGFDGTALHPSLSGMHQLFNDGKLGIVQAVSYPNPNFSHFRATDIWTTASDSNKILSTGWAGRFLDQTFPGFPEKYPNPEMPDPLAIQVGSVLSAALQGVAFPMGLAISNPSSFYKLIEGAPPETSDTPAMEQLNYIEEMSRKTDRYSGSIKNAALKITAQSPAYPAAGKNPLADQLKIVARLIAGGLKTKVYMVNIGSFDTHARQAETDTTTGNHAKLLERLSEAVTSFMADLEFLGIDENVMGITFSEFGRRIKSNASGGTDHGAAAPVFYFGHTVNSTIIGANPVIPEKVTPYDNVVMQNDFRSVYASVLQNWFRLPASDVNKVLMGEFPILPML